MKEASRVRARQSPNRCPFCHDHVEVEEAVACRDCLARHHAPCWSEGAGCSACPCGVRLQTSDRPALSPRTVTRILTEQGYSAAEVRDFLSVRELTDEPLPLGLIALSVALPLLMSTLGAATAGGISQLLGGSTRYVLEAALAFGIVGAVFGFAIVGYLWYRFASNRPR